MTFKNYEIYAIAEGLVKSFAETESTQKLPIKLSFTIRKNTAKFQAAAEQIEKSRMELLQKYGTQTEDGQGYIIAEDKQDAANKEYAELMSLEENIEISTVDINTLPDDLELTNAQMDALMFMFKDGSEEA